MAELNTTPPDGLQEADNAMTAAAVEPSIDAVAEPTPTPKKVIDYFRSQIQMAKNHRRTFSDEWKKNVDLRLGRIANLNTDGYGGTDTDDIRTEINPDWYLTKTKTANLYSQTPQVQCTHENQQFAPAIAPFAKALNYELSDKRANIGVAMEEVLNDVVNASGVGGVLVGYAARFETVEVPNIDTSAFSPEQVAALTASGQIQMVSTQKPTCYQFYARRISPSDLLWPAGFTGSNFNDADWVGHTDKMAWAVAKTEFKLTDAQKEAVVKGSGQPDSQDDLRAEPEKAAEVGFEVVKYNEIFYWRYRVDPDEKNFKSIWRMVFVDGLTETPVIDEPWLGQQTVDGTYDIVGATKFPLQFLTLTYVTDNPVPPSDSAAARPQVNDLRRSRNQYFMNRERSRPIRWFDVNRVDRTIQDSLMRGDYQGFIPSNGPGDRSIGEIARASYPQEDMAFDRQTMADMQAMWMIGQNQMGTFSSGEKTKAEVEMTQGNFNTRIGQERALVQKFFLNSVEVLAGLMALYSDFPNLTDDEKKRLFQAWDMRRILADLVLKVRPDSTIALDSSQRIDRLTRALNITAQSGVVNIQPIIAEILELSGLDPATVMKEPPAPKPEPAAISFRFTGKDDLMNQAVMALLVEQGQAPSPQSMQAAEQILMAAQQGMPPAMPGAPGAPDPQPPVTNGEPNSTEDYGLMPKVAQRSEDMGNA